MDKAIEPLDRIFRVEWTPEQLHAVAESYETIQSHTSFNGTVVRLASQMGRLDMDALRALVTGTMGRVEGTYWMVAGLATSHLALACSHLLTEAQCSLLLTPLIAGENAGRSESVFTPAA
ncbi:hypothetical protein ACX80W_12445 [Arthrobacter sp. TMN-37]